jgi:DNA-binding response OmpR family regulator
MTRGRYNILMKILLVEDEEVLAHNLKKILEGKGYIVDGIKAL